MPTPLLYLLPYAARAAYPAIVSGVRQGLSSRAITETIQQAGIRISRSRSVLPVMRELQKQETYAGNLRKIGKDRAINTGRLPEAITNIGREFSYTFRIDGLDEFGSLQTRHISVSTDDPKMTVGALEDIAMDAAESRQGSFGLSETRATLVYGIRRASTPITL